MNLFQSIVEGNRPFVIAEAGVNHNGDIRLAKKLIDAAKESGADAVKFQTWITENILSREAPLADYQERSGETSQFEMAKALELSFDQFRELKIYADQQGILFLSTPDDEESLEFLCSLKMPLIKIGSGEVTHHPYLKRVGQTGLPVILSTGMSTLEEVGEALEMLRSGGNRDSILLHCVSEYPAPLGELNLRGMVTLQKQFGGVVGFSDHTVGLEASLAATALGAKVLEKHFTLDKTMTGPDHHCSLNPFEFRQLVKGVEQVATMLGNGEKKPAPSELKNIPVVRRSLVAARDLKVGAVLNEKDILCKRPGSGFAPKELPMLIGKVLIQDIKADSLFQKRHFNGK